MGWTSACRSRGAFPVVAAIFATGALVASGEEENKAEVLETNAGSNSTAQSAAGGNNGGGVVKKAKVGDLVKLGDWQLQVNQVTDPMKPTNEFLTPEAGNRWVNVNMTVFNKSSAPATVSSLACFDVRDSEGQKGEVAIGGTGPQLDGEVPASEKLKGNVTFEVPQAAKGLELHFKCDFLSSGSAIVDLGT